MVAYQIELRKFSLVHDYIDGDKGVHARPLNPNERSALVVPNRSERACQKFITVYIFDSYGC